MHKDTRDMFVKFVLQTLGSVTLPPAFWVMQQPTTKFRAF